MLFFQTKTSGVYFFWETLGIGWLIGHVPRRRIRLMVIIGSSTPLYYLPAPPTPCHPPLSPSNHARRTASPGSSISTFPLAWLTATPPLQQCQMSPRSISRHARRSVALVHPTCITVFVRCIIISHIAFWQGEAHWQSPCNPPVDVSCHYVRTGGLHCKRTKI